MARSIGYDPTLPGPKPGVLPAKLTPIIVAPGGIEPPTSGSYVPRSNQLSYGALWLWRQDLHPQPPRQQRSALLLSYTRIYLAGKQGIAPCLGVLETPVLTFDTTSLC